MADAQRRIIDLENNTPHDVLHPEIASGLHGYAVVPVIDRVVYQGQGYEVKEAVIDIAATADVIAALADVRFKAISMFLHANGTETIAFVEDAEGTPVNLMGSATFDLTAGDGWVVPDAVLAGLETATRETSFGIECTNGAVQISGCMRYIELADPAP